MRSKSGPAPSHRLWLSGRTATRRTLSSHPDARNTFLGVRGGNRENRNTGTHPFHPRSRNGRRTRRCPSALPSRAGPVLGRCGSCCAPPGWCSRTDGQAMRFLERERTTTAKLLLGLDDGLRAVSLTELEAPAFSCSVTAVTPGCWYRSLSRAGGRRPGQRGAVAGRGPRHAPLRDRRPGHSGRPWCPGSDAPRGTGRRQSPRGVRLPRGVHRTGPLSPLTSATVGPGGVQVSGGTRPCPPAREVNVLVAGVMGPSVRRAGRGTGLDAGACGR